MGALIEVVVVVGKGLLGEGVVVGWVARGKEGGKDWARGAFRPPETEKKNQGIHFSHYPAIKCDVSQMRFRLRQESWP